MATEFCKLRKCSKNSFLKHWIESGAPRDKESLCKSSQHWGDSWPLYFFFITGKIPNNWLDFQDHCEWSMREMHVSREFFLKSTYIKKLCSKSTSSLLHQKWIFSLLLLTGQVLKHPTVLNPQHQPHLAVSVDVTGCWGVQALGACGPSACPIPFIYPPPHHLPSPSEKCHLGHNMTCNCWGHQG